MVDISDLPAPPSARAKVDISDLPAPPSARANVDVSNLPAPPAQSKGAADAPSKAPEPYRVTPTFSYYDKISRIRPDLAAKGREAFKEKVTPQELADGVSSDDEPRGFVGRATERGVMGALGAIAAPEFLRYGGRGLQMLPFAPAQAAGRAMQLAGIALSPLSKRVAPGVLGGLGGVSGEAVETVGDVSGFPKTGKAAGLATEFATQAVPGAIFSGVKMAGPSAIKVAANLFKASGIEKESLSQAQQKIFDEELKNLAGKLEQGLPQRELFGVMQGAVNNITAQAAKKSTLMETISGVAPKVSAARESQKAAEISKIGNIDRELTDVAGEVRNNIVARFSEQGLAQDAAYQAQKKIVDGIVLEKEQAGKFLEQLPEYKKIVESLDKKLLMNQAGLYEPTRKVSVPALVNNLKNIREALVRKSTAFGDSTNPKNMEVYKDLLEKGLPVKAVKDDSTGVTTFYREYPTAYEAVDALRRKLGDAAWKEGVEGFESLSREEARDFYRALDGLQSKYVGKAFDDLQEGYSLAGQLLEKYKGGVGAKATGVDKIDPSQFAKTDKNLVTTFFGGKSGVEQLVRLTGDQALVEKAASDYAAKSLADLKSSAQMKQWRIKNGDLLSSPYLRGLKEKINASIANVENIERKSVRSLEIGKSAAKKAGEIPKEAEKIAATILGDVSPQARVRDIILGGKKSTWDQIAPILSASPEGRRALSDSLNQVLADAAKTKRKSLPLLFRDEIAPFVQPMIGPEKVKDLQLQLNKLAGPLTPERITLAQKSLSAAIATAFGAAAGRAAEPTE